MKLTFPLRSKFGNASIRLFTLSLTRNIQKKPALRKGIWVSRAVGIAASVALLVAVFSFVFPGQVSAIKQRIVSPPTFRVGEKAVFSCQ